MSKQRKPKPNWLKQKRKFVILYNLKGPKVGSGFNDGLTQHSIGAWFLWIPTVCLPVLALLWNFMWYQDMGSNPRPVILPQLGFIISGKSQQKSPYVLLTGLAAHPEPVRGIGECSKLSLAGSPAHPAASRGDGGRATFTGTTEYRSTGCPKGNWGTGYPYGE